MKELSADKLRIRGMTISGPTRFHRANEALAFVCLFAGLFLTLSLVSYHPQDPSWNAVSSLVKPHNLIGVVGAHLSDLLLQLSGLGAFALPLLLWMVAWKWVRSESIETPLAKILGAALLFGSISVGFALGPDVRPWGGTFSPGGVVGLLLADYSVARINLAGTFLAAAMALILSFYLLTQFSMAVLIAWMEIPRRAFASMRDAWRRWIAARARVRTEKRELKKLEPAASPKVARAAKAMVQDDTPPWETSTVAEVSHDDIPIHELEFTPGPPAAIYLETRPPAAVERRFEAPRPVASPANDAREYHVPPTDLLNEPPPKSVFDSLELKEIATRIKSKLEEFNVLGNVVQINPGPVVTTFEFKPEAGIKYSRITTLNEDLCLGLQAESILIERIPGKPTVGVEVPNSRREVISLRQILESEEFQTASSRMTICLGKDINGRIKVAALESMPHLLIAGSTGSGKSVMLNSLIMSILYKATPDEVRLILVDPKRLEMGLYEGIPHLLTPVITDAKKATYALRNAVLEMERRLKQLAKLSVRNIDQYNKKVKQLAMEPLSLFDDDTPPEEELKPLPFILIVIDELADLMMLERANVEESVTRLAQMARAVGMHLVLATQRPSVDVITGLIKANFPSRISFRVATRVDSRTVLDVMGAEHLLGKGDMLFLPPGSSRLVRVHGAFVTEQETNRVVDFWKKQGPPDYQQELLMPPPEDAPEGEGAEFEGGEDPMYHDAVKVVMEMGKASTSTLQRRLRLGYGRAARILDMMQRDGIIGPPDGSKPREVLKRPDWLEEVETLR